MVLLSEEISVASLPASFIESARTEKIEGYFPDKASLQMITAKAIIYPSERKELFCLYLQRDVELAILGITDSEDLGLIESMSPEEVIGTFKMVFGSKQIPRHFKDLAVSNWNIIVD